MFADAGAAVRDVARLVRPPRRMKVSDAVAESVRVVTPGGGVANWDPTVAPYVLEPMDTLNSRRNEAVIFVGPARTGKTMGLVDGWIGYMVTCEPSDMLVVQMSQEKARDYSRLRVNRLLRNSPVVGAELAGSRSDDNTFDKWFRSGVALKIGWPTINQLSSNDFKFVALTDYDRMPQDVDREGSPFALGQKRTQTYMSRGMTLAESSPGFPVLDPNWKPRTPHEAPPARGIMSLYNMGDRRRWYWLCPHCGDYYMQPPGIEGFAFTHHRDLFGITDAELVGAVHVVCTECSALIGEEHKPQMNASALWVPDGCRVEREGRTYGVVGSPRDSKIASFWMSGAAAAYQSWSSIVGRYLAGLRHYELTGDEEALKSTTTVDQGTAYLPRVLAATTDRTAAKSRAENFERYAVPDGARALIATVDVQGGEHARFVVQVHGIGARNEKWLVDRYNITEWAWNEGEEPRPVNPASHIEDWDAITYRVALSTYKLPDGRELRVYRTGVDSGGEEGVSERAYEWYRGLRRRQDGLHRRVRLIKGADSKMAPKVEESFPDSTKRKDRKSGGRGDVPVLILAADKLKDAVSNDLSREEPGPGYMHFPTWIGQWFYDELAAERRDENGHWIKITKRNEAWDLLVYCYAVLFDLRYDRVDWSAPPAWLRPWAENPDVITAEERRALQQRGKSASTKAAAAAAAPAARQRQARFVFN